MSVTDITALADEKSIFLISFGDDNIPETGEPLGQKLGAKLMVGLWENRRILGIIWDDRVSAWRVSYED